MATINYADKVALNINPDIDDINKVNASDMNLIKQVGNQILTTIGVYTDDWSSSETYAAKSIVIYDNRVFINLTGNNTATPPDQDTTNWQETTIAELSAGVNIPIQPNAPENPEEDDLWIDTSENQGSNVSPDYYSTTEVKTNKIWIDGKPIYRKVVITDPITTDLGTAFSFTIATGIETLTNASAFTQTTGHARYLPILAQQVQLESDWDLDRSSHTLYLYLKRPDTTSYSNGVVHCIIEYTKITN